MFTGAVVIVAVALNITDWRYGVGSGAHSIRVAEAVLKLDFVLIPVSSQNSLDLCQKTKSNAYKTLGKISLDFIFLCMSAIINVSKQIRE